MTFPTTQPEMAAAAQFVASARMSQVIDAQTAAIHEMSINTSAPNASAYAATAPANATATN